MGKFCCFCRRRKKDRPGPDLGSILHPLFSRHDRLLDQVRIEEDDTVDFEFGQRLFGSSVSEQKQDIRRPTSKKVQVKIFEAF